MRATEPVQKYRRKGSKFRSTVALFVVSSLALLVSACAQQAAPAPATSPATPAPVKAAPAPAPAEQRFSIGGGSAGGAYHIVASTMADVITKNIPGVRATGQTTGGAVENLNLVGTKQALIGFTMEQSAYEAYKDLAAFKGKNFTHVRALTPGYTTGVYIIVRKDSTINSFQDLRGKKVVLGQAGSGVTVTAETMFTANGLVPNKDFTAQYLSMVASLDALKDRLVDASVLAGGIQSGTRNTAIPDIASTTGVRFIQLTDAELKKVNDVQPFYRIRSVKPIFPEVTPNEYKTVALVNMAVTSADADPTLIYNIVKTMFERSDEMNKVHPANGEFLDKDAITGLPIPLHPGAEKYYKEKGWIK